MDTQIEDILDRILQSYPQTVFTKNIEFIKKTNANLEDVDTIQSIKTLAILLEVFQYQNISHFFPDKHIPCKLYFINYTRGL